MTMNASDGKSRRHSVALGSARRPMTSQPASSSNRTSFSSVSPNQGVLTTGGIASNGSTKPTASAAAYNAVGRRSSSTTQRRSVIECAMLRG